MKKMVINHIDKIFVTSDAATIMKEVSYTLITSKDKLNLLLFLLSIVGSITSCC